MGYVKKQKAAADDLGYSSCCGRGRGIYPHPASDAANRKNRIVFARSFIYPSLFLSDRYFADRWWIEKNIPLFQEVGNRSLNEYLERKYLSYPGAILIGVVW